MSEAKSKVLIIGAGPTGMTAAMELTRLGVPVRIVERAAEPSTTSRALAVQSRTLELFAQRDLLQRMLARGNPAKLVTVYDEKEPLFQIDFSHNGTDFPYILLIPQSDTEQLLRDELARLGVVIEREVEYTALALGEHDAQVTAVLRHKDGFVEEVQSEYLIDSEGAHSITRTTLGLEFQGKTRTEEYVLGDVHIDGGPPKEELTIFSSKLGFMGMFPMQGGRFRLIASNPLRGTEPNAEPTLDEIQAIYDQRSPLPGKMHDMVWSSYFRINSRMIHSLHKGRVFLGGDAAHIHSPAGGQGMNTGIQDMINLGWKMAMVIHGKASPKLLDTYTEDRVPVIKGVLEGTEGLTDLIATHSAPGRFALEHFAPWLMGTELAQGKATKRMSQVLFDYRESALSKTVHAGGSLHAGDRMPNLPIVAIRGAEGRLNSGVSTKLQEVLSSEVFTFLQTNATGAESATSELPVELAPWSGMICSVNVAPQAGDEDIFRDLFGKNSAIALVRPDGYTAFVGRAEDLPLLVDYLASWFPATSNG